MDAVAEGRQLEYKKQQGVRGSLIRKEVRVLCLSALHEKRIALPARPTHRPSHDDDAARIPAGLLRDGWPRCDQRARRQHAQRERDDREHAFRVAIYHHGDPPPE